MKTIVRMSARTSLTSIEAASPSALPRMPVFSSSSGVFQIAIWRSGRGPLSRSTSCELLARESLGELQRIGDRRAGHDDPRLRAVGGCDPPQPAQHVGDVRAEDAAIDVRLVDDDPREVGEEVGPLAVVRQHALVEHVGVAEHEVAALADLLGARRWACRRRRSRGATRRCVRGPAARSPRRAGRAFRAWSCASALVG